MSEEKNQEKIRVLIVDDDRKLCRLVRDYLDPFGYDVASAYTGPKGLEKALEGDFQVVLLDVMLPGMDGFEVLRALRRESDVPVLMLTARGEETDRIVGLEMGADDYLPKTFSSRELLARLRAVTRRTFLTQEKSSIDIERPVVIGDFRIDPASRSIYFHNDALELTPVEFDILACLARAAGRVLTRDQLLDHVAGRDYEVFDRSIDVHISSLRRKLGDDPRTPRFIKTVRSVGYMFLEQAGATP
ncbi:response regulator transcription factor [Thermodesulfobacteriota bacterium]